MAVIMEDEIAEDIRFEIIALKLNITVPHVAGCCYYVWRSAYHRKSNRLRIEEANTAARHPSFAEAMIEAGLADRDGDCIVLHGVQQRLTLHPPKKRTGPRRNPEVTHTPFRPPTFQEVSDYCLERQNGIDPARFIDYYASNGWKVGKQPMKDWRAAIRTWERNAKERSNGQSTTGVAQQAIANGSRFLKMFEG